MTHVVVLQPGQIYEIERGDNPTTGYRWTTAATQGLSVSSKYLLSCDEPGCGGKRIWSIFADKPDVYLFSAFHGQTWELKSGQTPKVESFLFRVVANVTQAASKEQLLDANVVVYLDDQGSMIAYKNKGIIYTADGVPHNYTTSIDYVIPVHGNITFYEKDSQYYYLHKPDGADMMNTLYDIFGTEVGVPSGGLTGRGDGKTTMKGMRRLGSIRLI